MASLPTLHYFAFRGRALACRVALFNALGPTGWIDTRVSLPKFKQEPKPARNPDRLTNGTTYVTNNLPQLNLPDGTKVTQSHAIARYAAKLSSVGSSTTFPEYHVKDLYPTDPQRALLVDEAISVVDQILLLTPKDPDVEVRAKRRREYHESGFLRVGMELLEGRLRISAKDGPFILGDQLTIADLYVRAPLADLFDLKQFDGIPDSFYSDFPHVKKCAASVLDHPLLKAYHTHYKN